MKTILTSLLLISFLSGFAQEEEETEDTTAQPEIGTKEYYLQKSINERRTGRTLLLAGTGLIIAGVVVGDSEPDEPKSIGLGPNFETSMTLLVIGLLVDLASIPCFASASKNAQRAAEIKEVEEKNLNSFEKSKRGRRHKMPVMKR